MSVFALKVLAMLSMVCDHLGWWLLCEGWIGPGMSNVMRGFGRLAFPIFAFLIVNGYEHTKNRAGYLTRLTGFALLSQLPYVMVFSAENYSAAAGALSLELPGAAYMLLCLGLAFLWYRFVRADASALLAALAPLAGLTSLRLGGLYLLRPDMNVFYTLALSLGAMCALDMLTDKNMRGAKAYAAAAAVLAALLLIWDRADYGLNGILLILILWYFRQNRTQQLFMLAVWAAAHYIPGGNFVFFICAAAAAFPLYLYNGRLGKPLKTVFYLVYPLHLSAMALVILWQTHI